MNNATTQTSDASQWRVGTVTHIMLEAIGIRSYTFTFDTPVQHAPGQYYELRLTAADGYQAARLYSAAMPANGTANTLQLTISLMDHGEISPYIFRHVTKGSQIEIRGPFGRYFVWRPDQSSPLLLISGGTGVIPLRAIRLEHQQAASKVPLRLLHSVRNYYDLPYKYELFPRNGTPPEDVSITFTEKAPAGWKGYTRRIDEALLTEVLQSYQQEPSIYLCGPTPFVESVANALLAIGQPASNIKAERFGPTATV